jgi:hypothetical protein
MCQAQSVQVFDHHYLSTASGFASTSVSEAIPVVGNKAAVATLIINITSSASVTITLEGSYDGTAWDSVTSSAAQTTFTHVTISQGSIAYAFLRVKVVITGTTQSVLFSSTVAQTSQ